MRTLLLTLAVLTLAMPLSGCFYSREIAHTRRAIERHTGAEFDRQVVVSIGPRTLRTLGWMVGLAPDDEARMAQDYLHEIRRVKVGVYRAEYLPDLDDVALPLGDRFERDGWEVAVQAREGGESMWLLYREYDDEVRDLYVFVLDDENLVLARINGHLNRLFARAMEDHLELRDWVHEIDMH